MTKVLTKTILILPGDGIGPEVTHEAIKLFNWFNEHTDHLFNVESSAIGGHAIALSNTPLPIETIELAKEADAILLGAVGGPKWDKLPTEKKPEKGLLALRKQFDLYSNLRPISLFPALLDISPIKKDILRNTDLMIVRELTGDVYFGQPRSITVKGEEREAINTMRYSTIEIERIARTAFDLARTRRNKVCSIDKANVLEVSVLWREIVRAIHDLEYSDVQLTHMYVDNAAMQLIRNPSQFDVLLTPNLFGDILSDEAAMLVGSLGMLPSASLGKTQALYEPIHGSAPDIADKDLANPIAAILSVAMMLRYSFKLNNESEAIYKAVNKVLNAGFRTADIMTTGCTQVTTTEMGNKIIAALSL